MIDLDATYLEEIKAILRKELPNITVKAFGSRVTGRAKRYSDLDLVLIDDAPIPIGKLNKLRFAFSDSGLPIMVDVVDWSTISTEFRAAIREGGCETLIPGRTQ